MAHKKGVGSTDNGRDSNSKRLGVKLFGGQVARAGNIILRQRGTKYHPGENVYMGRDFTIHAKVDGNVSFRKSYRNRMYVSIVPDGSAAPVVAKPAPKKKAAPKPAPAPKPVAKVAAPKPAPAPAPEPTPAPNTTVQAAAAIPAAKPAKKAKAVKIELPSGKKIKQDDLTAVEGIGPKISSLLNEIGVVTWRELSETPIEKIQEMLDAAGPRYRIHNPGTWPKQAGLAADEKWAELEELQDRLDGGKEVE